MKLGLENLGVDYSTDMVEWEELIIEGEQEQTTFTHEDAPKDKGVSTG